MKKIWVKEKCQEEALKYKTRGDFRKYSGSVYVIALKEKWIDEICMHMEVIKYPKGYWTKERCQEEALKYKTRSEFSKNSVSAYGKAWDSKWLDEICSHMITIGNHYNRSIYSFEFNDNHVYVGLTYDIEKRKKQHYKRGPVIKHIINTGEIPVFKILTNYISNELAVIKEKEFLDYYINNNWKILNSMKPGALGGGKTKWTRDKCQEEALKYHDIKSYRKDSLSYRAAVRNKWLDEICSHMNRSKNVVNYWTKDNCIKHALLCNSRIEFSKKFPGGYAASRNNGWLDEICSHMKYVEKKPKGYWTKDNCKKEAMNYNTRGNFQKNSRSAYQISSRNGWLDEICSHMFYATS
jgi:predicted GIY-YIG superfamily endonuclease